MPFFSVTDTHISIFAFTFIENKSYIFASGQTASGFISTLHHPHQSGETSTQLNWRRPINLSCIGPCYKPREIFHSYSNGNRKNRDYVYGNEVYRSDFNYSYLRDENQTERSCSVYHSLLYQSHRPSLVVNDVRNRQPHSFCVYVLVYPCVYFTVAPFTDMVEL